MWYEPHILEINIKMQTIPMKMIAQSDCPILWCHQQQEQTIHNKQLNYIVDWNESRQRTIESAVAV